MTASQRAQSALLAARLAHQRREASVDAYRTAIAQATRAGVTYTELARTLREGGTCAAAPMFRAAPAPPGRIGAHTKAPITGGPVFLTLGVGRVNRAGG